MATRLGQIFLDIRSRVGEFRRTTRDARQETQQLGRTAQQAGQQGSQGFFALRDGAVKFGDTMQKVFFAIEGVRTVMRLIGTTAGRWQEAAAEQERVTAALNTALRQQGIVSRDVLRDLQNYANERQRVTGFDNEATENLLAQLVVMGVHRNELERTATVAQDLATVMGIDLRSAARLLAQALDGQMGAISRYVAGLDATKWEAEDTAGRLAMLEEKVGGQAEAFGETGAGALRIFRAEMADVEKNLGTVVLAFSQEVIPILSVFTQWLAEMETGVLAGRIALGGLVGGLALFAMGMLGPISLMVALVAGFASLVVWYRNTQREAEERIKQMAREKVGVDEYKKSLDELSKTQLQLDIQEAERNIQQLRTRALELTDQLEEIGSGWRRAVAVLSAPFFRARGMDDMVRSIYNVRLAIQEERKAWQDRKKAAEEALDPDVPDDVGEDAIRKMTDEEKSRLEVMRKQVQLGDITRDRLLEEIRLIQSRINYENEILDLRLEANNIEKEIMNDRLEEQEKELERERELTRLRVANIENEFERRKQEIKVAFNEELENARKLFTDAVQLREAEGEIAKRLARELYELERERLELLRSEQMEFNRISAEGITDRYERERELIRLNYRERIQNIQDTWQNEALAMEAMKILEKQMDEELHESRLAQTEEEYRWFLNSFHTAMNQLGREFQRMIEGVFRHADNIFTRVLTSWINAIIQELIRLAAVRVASSIIGLISGGTGTGVIGAGFGAVTSPTRTGPGQWVPGLADGAVVRPRVGGTLANIAEAGESEFILPFSRIGEFLENIQINVPDQTAQQQQVMIDLLASLRTEFAEKEMSVFMTGLLKGQTFLREEVPTFEKNRRRRTLGDIED